MAKKRDSAKTQRVREELWKTFFHEIEELLENLEHQLLSIENDQQNLELIAGLFRTMHTIKGTCGMMGLTKIEGLAHKAEDMMDLVRDQKLALNDDMMDLMFEALDTFKAGKTLIVECKSDESLPISEQLVTRIQGYIQQAANGDTAKTADAQSDAPTASPTEVREDSTDSDLWLQLAQECIEQLDNAETLGLHLESFPDDANTIDSLFRVLHSLKGSFNLAGLSSMTQLLHLAEDLVGLTRDGAAKADQKITDALLSVIDQVRSHLSTHKSKRTDLSAKAITGNTETLKALILSIDPDREAQRLDASAEPQLTVGDGQIEIDSEYLEIFFEIVWRSLNVIKKTLQTHTPEQQEKTNADLEEALEEILHAAGQMQLTDALNIVSDFLELIKRGTNTDGLIEPLNALWHFFWDLEESLPTRLSKAADVQSDTASEPTDALSTELSTPAHSVADEAQGSIEQSAKPELQQQSADDFFDNLWPELARLRKSIEKANTEQNIKDAQEQNYTIERITQCVQEIDLSHWLQTIQNNLAQPESIEKNNALSKAVQEIYTLCWDLEDQLQGSMVNVNPPACAPEIKAIDAGEEHAKHEPEHSGGSITEIKSTDKPSDRIQEASTPEPNISMAASMSEPPTEASKTAEIIDLPNRDMSPDPAIVTQDPLFALDFLEKSQEDMGQFQKLKLSWQRNEPNCTEAITAHLNQFAETAQRLGFQSLQNTILEFIQSQIKAQWLFDANASKQFELTVFGLLTKIEESLPESASNRHHNELNISHIFKQWHANQFFHTLEDCNVTLESLKTSCISWQQGQLSEHELNQQIKRACTHVESIIFTCQYYALSQAEEALLHVNDTLVRTEYDKSKFTVDQLDAIASVIKHIGSAVHAINETGVHDGSDVEAAYQKFRALVGNETNDAHIQTAKKFFESLTLPACVLEVFNETVMSTVGKKLADSENLFLLFIDIEHDEALAEKTFELLESGAFETIVNATDYVEDRSAFHFLVHSSASEGHLIQLLKAIDPSTHYLRIEVLKPKSESTASTAAENDLNALSELSAGQLSASVNSADLTDNLEGLQSTVGELISVKANLGQLSQSMSGFNLFEFIDKEIQKNGSSWQKAKDSVRQYVQNYDADLRDLIKAQEDVGHVLDKLQQDVNNIREVPVLGLFEDIEQWFNQTAAQRQDAPKLKTTAPELRIERNMLEQLNLPLRQLLFVFKQFGEASPKASVSLSAHVGSQYHSIEFRCQETCISASLLQSWGLPEDSHPATWLSNTKELPPKDSAHAGDYTPAVNLQTIRESLSAIGVTLAFFCDHKGWQGFCLKVSKDNQVIDGITVIAQDSYYIFPVQLVKRIINLDDAKRVDASASNHKELIEIDHNVVPLVRLKNEHTKSPPERQIVLILTQDTAQRAIVVDELVGLQQVLVTPLEGQLAGASQYQGCAVLGKDRIGMVVSAGAIF
jgi:chemotaxis protein histidine kinase CheA